MAAPRKVRTRCEFEFHEQGDQIYRQCVRCRKFAEHIAARGTPRLCLPFAKQALDQHPHQYKPADEGEAREELVAATREESPGYDRGE